MEKKPWNSLSGDWIACIRCAADLHEYPNTRGAAHVGIAATHARTITVRRLDDLGRHNDLFNRNLDNSRSENCQSNDLVHLEHHINFDVLVRTLFFVSSTEIISSSCLKKNHRNSLSGDGKETLELSFR